MIIDTSIKKIPLYFPTSRNNSFNRIINFNKYAEYINNIVQNEKLIIHDIVVTRKSNETYIYASATYRKLPPRDYVEQNFIISYSDDIFIVSTENSVTATIVLDKIITKVLSSDKTILKLLTYDVKYNN